MNNIIIFKINRKLDFRNHLIGIKYYKGRFKQYSSWYKYYQRLERSSKNKRFEIFKKETAVFYDPTKRKFRHLLIKQTQQAWDLFEKDFFRIMKKIHKKEFPHKHAYGIISTATRYGYSFNNTEKWFACSSESPLKSLSIAMHELMHLFFHKYFQERLQKKYCLNHNQLWAIKEAVTVILNLECNHLMLYPDVGYPSHARLRVKIAKDWKKYKNFTKVLDKICEYVKKKKLFLK